MRTSDINQGTTSDYQSDVNVGFQDITGQAAAPQTNTKSSSSNKPQRTPDPFEKFVERFPVSFYYFAQNPNTAHLIEETDKDKLVSAVNTLQNRSFVTYFTTMATNMTIMNILNRRNKIFALTRRISLAGILFKYFLIPNVVTDVLGRLIYVPAYNQTAEPIKQRYTFQDPIFKMEYEKDPHPEAYLQQFYETRFSSKPFGSKESA